MAEPEVYIDYELIKYQRLQKVIDKLVNSESNKLLSSDSQKEKIIKMKILSNDEFEPSEKSSENSSGKTVGIVANNESDEINEGGIINNIEKSNGENMNNDETNVDGEDIDEVRNFILCYDNI